MYRDCFVVDATVHGFNFLPSNYQADFLPELMQMLYHGAHIGFHPRDDNRYNLSWNEFIDSFEAQPQLLEQVMFAESSVDVAVYHGVPLEGIYKDGSSPLWVASALKKRLPDRVVIYGPLYPWMAGALDRIDQMLDEHAIVGLKFYPVDLVTGELKVSRMDTDAAMACVEHAQRRGLRSIAVHKAVPLGPLPQNPFGSMYDMAPVIAAFPDMHFEIVHGGAAFIPETAALLSAHQNVSINLESLTGFINHPGHVKTWVELMTAFLEAGAADRIFYASGALGNHPQAMLETFMRFEMPVGRPPLTPEIKAGILGANYLSRLGFELPVLRERLAKDEYGQRSSRALEDPWSYLRRFRAAASERSK